MLVQGCIGTIYLMLSSSQTRTAHGSQTYILVLDDNIGAYPCILVDDGVPVIGCKQQGRQEVDEH